MAPTQLTFSLDLDDLSPIMAGEGVPLPQLPLDAPILFHVRKGHGTLHRRSTEHRVGPGRGFVLHPGETASFVSAPEETCDYVWIAFRGKLADSFCRLPPVFTLPKGSLRNICGLQNAPRAVGYLLAGDLFTLYAQLLEPGQQERDQLLLIVEHIEKNYMQKLTVENFALRFNMDRRYLSQQFKARYGISIRAYLTKIRIEHAARYLSMGHSATEAATLCGFEDTSNFHKMFTDHYGMTPNEWKARRSK
ncbi:MAG: helix-turn-helix transcriptional regulator [Oscillospiraceae bacterium]|nr:helix-turn-helix transcriptional regulator [Oscillospiraceae bacterium]